MIIINLAFTIHLVYMEELIYRIYQGERSKFYEVIVSVILSKKLCMYMCFILNGFRDRAISLCSILYR
jgi:hypothetical protein